MHVYWLDCSSGEEEIVPSVLEDLGMLHYFQKMYITYLLFIQVLLYVYLF